MTDFIRIPSNPVPQGGEVFYIETADGAKLRAALFPAASSGGTVVLMSGRSEFIEKYFEVIEDLRSRGFSVATMDWRGQGLSSRALPDSEKGHIGDFETYKSDLRNFIEETVKPRFGGPYILMTHSMGGLPALMLLADGYDLFARAVLCAPMTEFHVKPAMRVLALVSTSIAMALGRSHASVLGVQEYSLQFEGNKLTSDRKRHDRFRELQTAAPNACIFAPTYSWLHAATKAIDEMHEPGRLDTIKTPVLIVSAEKDALVEHDDHVALARDNKMIECVTVHNALHEILMERDEFRDQFWKAFDDFIAPVSGS